MAPYKRFRVSKHVICNHPGCRRMTEGSFCPEHTKRPSPKRSDRDRFLDSVAWRKLSTWQLRNVPWCEDCQEAGRTRPATDADHVHPRHSHPHLALEPTNLRSLCKRCHGIKTGKGL